MEFRYFSRNGELRPIAEAVIPLSHIEYQYGFGVYESLRVEKDVAYFLDEHSARLMESARIIGLVHDFSLSGIARSVRDLIAQIQGTYNLKILLIGGPEPLLFILPLNPLFPDKKIYRDGAHTITVSYERMYPQAKTLNMFGSYMAYAKAREAGAQDALLLDASGHIIEGTRTNFFCIKGKTLISPPERLMLHGVTRKIVLKVAREQGFELIETDIRPEDLGGYDGAFITSTSSGILPLASIDAFKFAAQPAPLIELRRAFDTFIDNSGGIL